MSINEYLQKERPVAETRRQATPELQTSHRSNLLSKKVLENPPKATMNVSENFQGPPRGVSTQELSSAVQPISLVRPKSKSPSRADSALSKSPSTSNVQAQSKLLKREVSSNAIPARASRSPAPAEKSNAKRISFDGAQPSPAVSKPQAPSSKRVIGTSSGFRMSNNQPFATEAGGNPSLVGSKRNNGNTPLANNEK